MVFTKAKNGEEGDAVLDRIFFWTMPNEDLEIARLVWEDTKEKVLAGVYDDFIKISDDMICHVRPKAKNSMDLTPNPQGDKSLKKAFWLNREYILKIVKSNIEGRNID